jgi:Zn-dependent M16 (insulinase) family peptidase
MDSHGFTPVAERDLPIAGVRARRLVHEASGAEVLLLAGTEPNLSFAVGFQTLPDDDTGVAHILEHMVLAGSDRFPLKDPFFEMIKGSLAGFLNAMTYPDRTVYPFATEHPQDFLNLLQVYLDAVFRPRLSETTFQQEAWHLEPGENDAALQLRGVVYNEMKGAVANPSRALQHTETTALFPDTAYRHESGGDPVAIPDLTYDDLVAFHAAHYHPARARFVLHGDVPLEATLATIASYLEGVEPSPPLPPPALQAPFDAPREAHGAYPADARGKAFATVAWALPPVEGPGEELALDLLDHVLVGTPAAPLRRALLDAGLGEAFVGGLSTTLRQPAFHAGLRGVAPERAGEVHALVLATLRRIAEEGVDAGDAEAARNALEFDLRELDVYGGQRGLALALDALGAWLHGGDPLEQVDLDAALADLDARIAPRGDGAAAASALTELLRARLLDNPHRVTTTVRPDPGLSEARASQERERLAARASELSEDDLAEIAAAATRLAEAQQAPDPPEARATLPRLAREDLRDARPRPAEQVRTRAGVEIVRYDLPTRGLVYLDLAFDLRRVPERFLPHVGLLGRLLLETGTARRSLQELTRAIDRDTGGVGAAFDLAPGVAGGRGLARFFVRGKALAGRAGAMAELMAEIVREANVADVAAVRRLAVEELARRRAAIEPAGHRFALRRLAAHGSVEERADEALGGLASLDALARLIERCDDDPAAVAAELEELREALFTRGGLVVGLTADEAASAPAHAAIDALLERLPAGGEATDVAWSLPTPRPREGWTLPGQVHYVATGVALRDGGPLPGGWLAAARWLTGDLFIPQVRFQGGAYGAGAQLDPLHGALRTYSYRDPHLERTLEVARGMADALRTAAREIDPQEFETLVIGAVGGLDPYALPGARGHRELLRRLRGSQGQLERLRSELLDADPGAFVELADAIEAAGEPALVVLGADGSLRERAPRLGLELREPG